MFGCKCCSSSIESLDLTKEQTDIVVKRNNLNKPKSYKKLRLSGLLPENYWVNSHQVNTNSPDIKLNSLEQQLDTKAKSRLINDDICEEETKPKQVKYNLNRDDIEKISETRTFLNQSNKSYTLANTGQSTDGYNLGESIYNFDYNLYSVKKNIGQGMIDLALLAANATQLKNVFSKGYNHFTYFKNFSTNNTFLSTNPLYINSTDTNYFGDFDTNNTNIDKLWSFYLFWLNIALIGTSIFLQIIVGILLLLNAKSNKKIASKPKGNAECYNNTILIFILFITVINVFIVIFVDEI